MTLTHVPAMRITCRRASDHRRGERGKSGVLITTEDLKTLRLLAGRDISVALMCEGRIAYEGQVKGLLRRSVYLADRNLWYIPITPTGPLKLPRLAPLVK